MVQLLPMHSYKQIKTGKEKKMECFSKSSIPKLGNLSKAFLLLASVVVISMNRVQISRGLNLATGEQKSYPTVSNEWLHQCVSTVSKNATEVVPFDIEWPGYVLGDCIRGCRACFMPPRVEGTFAKHYDEQNCQGNKKIHNNVKFVRNFLNSYSNETNFTKPSEDEVVLHLRLGDMLEKDQRDVGGLLIAGGKSGWNGGHSRIKGVNEMLKAIAESGKTKVVIVGGAQNKMYGYKKSRIYAGCVKRAIEHANYTVSGFKIEGNPDADFYFMSFAKAFVTSSGGYSSLIGKLVQMNNGKVIGDHWHMNLSPDRPLTLG